jgi:CheY-like chemotaxis protein
MTTAIGRQIGLFIKRKQAEEALIQSEKLKSIGTITAGVAHEFNNILAIISGNAQLLEGSRKDDEELVDAIRTIKRMANDGAEISRRMLKFTNTAKDTAGFVPIDINELINQVIDFTTPRWKNMAQAKGINYHMDTEGMKGIPKVLCNPTELREMFINIINNALDAMPDDGRITFRTWSEEDTVLISVSDTGEGIPEEVKKNIFDPFFTTRSPVGTGLGLSTAYGILARHGGSIEVESAVGRGSTFTLQFPSAAKADSPKESPEPKQEIKRDSLRILVVDDEEEICNILDKFFSKKGHLVRTVDNGTEAKMLTKIDDYDLVLCDLAMPNVYGYDVIKTLNKLEKRPKIGIITGWGEKLKPIDDEDLKVDFIIKKPFDFSELTKHINDVFGADSR